MGVGLAVFGLHQRGLRGRPCSGHRENAIVKLHGESPVQTGRPDPLRVWRASWRRCGAGELELLSPGMVEVLGPWLVPDEAVVREPTAGARMKSMSPSRGKPTV